MPARPVRAPRRPSDNARRNRRASSLAATAAAAAATTLLAPHPARALDRYWVGTNNTWTSNSWSAVQNGAAGASVPAIGDKAFVLFNDATSRTITYNNPTPLNLLDTLSLDNTGAGTSIFSQAQGVLGTTLEYVGSSGNGAYTLSAGTNSANTLYLGLNVGGRGAYTLSGTGVLNTGVTYVGAQGGGTFTQSGGTHTAASTLYVGQSITGTNVANGTYDLSGGALTVGNASGGVMNVGYSGTGTFNQSGSAAVTTFDLFLGRFNNGGGTNAAGFGSYSMSNTATLTVRNQAIVGEVGGGAFVQNGGAVTFTNATTGALIVGRQVGGSGSYTLNSGSITLSGSASEYVGMSGGGTFLQTGGTNTVSASGALYVGYNASGTNVATGAYTMTGGTLNTGYEYIGGNGVGTFNQTNGAHVTNGLFLGSSPSGVGPSPAAALNLAGGTYTVHGSVAAGVSGNAAINQTGGTFTVDEWLYVGLGFGTPGVVSPASATYRLSAGTLNAYSQSVGYTGTNTSTFTQTGGVNNAPGFLTVGDQFGSRGVYNLGNGALTPYRLNVGWLGAGTVNQSGGTNNANGLFLGHESNGTGTYTLSGGVLNIGIAQTGELDASTYVGYAGAGSFVQTGGTHTIAHSNSGGVYVGYFPGSTGSYRLDNGTLNVSYLSDRTVVGYEGTGTFTQNGGVHLASNLWTGQVGTGVGTYTLNNGTLTVEQEVHGVSGAGTFIQNAGTHSATSLDLGRFASATGSPGTGAYTLAGGTLAVYFSETIGHGGVGTFTQTGGANTLGDAVGVFQLTIGADVTAVGSYTLSAGSLTVNGPETVGDFGTGTFTQTGGFHSATSTLTIARQPGSTGAYHLTGGFLTAPIVNNGSFDLGAATYTGAFVNNRTLNVTAVGSTFTGTLANSPAGVTYVNFPLTVSAGVTNAGSLVLPGTTLTANGAGLNNDGGNITLTGATLAGSGPVLNSGTIVGYGTITGNGSLTNNGVITQTYGNLTFAKSAGAINNNQITLAPGRQLALSTALTNSATLELNAATVSGPAPLLNSAAGLIIGPGTITAPLTNAGTIALPTGTLNLQQPLTSSGAIQLTSFTAHLVGGSINNTGTIQGLGVVSNPLTNNGTIEALGGTLTLTGPLTNNPSGILRAATGSKLLASTGLANNAGVVNLAGGTFDNNALPLVNTGQLSGFGTFATGGLTNNGAIFLTGGNTTVNGPVTNTPGNKISVRYNPALFTGPVSNAGTLEVIGATATFAAGGPLPAPLPGAPLAAPLPGGALDGPGTTTLTAGAALVADHVRQSVLNIADGTVTLRPGATLLEPARTSVVNALALGPTSRLDLANNALIIDYTGASPLADIRSYVLTARHGGDWLGPGLTSSLIPTTRNAVIGFGEASTILGASGGTFAGQPADPTSILVRLTIAGDATFDARVNFDDLLTLAKNYNKSNVSYAQGDFTYDGVVNFDDLLTLAKNYNGTLTTAAASGLPAEVPATFAADLAAITTAQAPEPSTLATIAACGFALSTRRRRRTRRA